MPSPQNTPETFGTSRAGPWVGAAAVVAFLTICLFAYLTFEPDAVEPEEDGAAVVDGDSPATDGDAAEDE